jgi:[CysO sulfur-carrier protein]-S-L-cysteine hydrolase
MFTARWQLLRILRTDYEEMIAQARAEQPNECVGLLAGVVEAGVGRVVRRYPLVNAAASPVLYIANDHMLFKAHKDMRDSRLEMLAVYHSHPTSPAVPSATDHAQWMHGPEVVCLILSLLDDPPSMRGWLLDEDRREEVVWEVE